GLRNALYDSGRLRAHRLPCRVISIGNLTLGGTGKSPLTSWVASLLRESGYRVGVVSRGYGRTGTRSVLLVSDGKTILAEPRRAVSLPPGAARVRRAGRRINRSRFAEGIRGLCLLGHRPPGALRRRSAVPRYPPGGLATILRPSPLPRRRSGAGGARGPPARRGCPGDDGEGP